MASFFHQGFALNRDGIFVRYQDVAPSAYWGTIPGHPSPVLDNAAQGGASYRASTSSGIARPQAAMRWVGSPQIGPDQYAMMQTSPPISSSANFDPLVCARMGPDGSCYAACFTYGDTSDYEYQISQQITTLVRFNGEGMVVLGEWITWGWEYDASWPRTSLGDWRDGPIRIAPYIGDMEFTAGLRVWGSDPVHVQVICQHPYKFDFSQAGTPGAVFSTSYAQNPGLYYGDPAEAIAYSFGNPGAEAQQYIFPDPGGAVVGVPGGTGCVSPVRSFLIGEVIDSSPSRITSGQPGMRWLGAMAYEAGTLRGGDLAAAPTVYDSDTTWYADIPTDGLSGTVVFDAVSSTGETASTSLRIPGPSRLRRGTTDRPTLKISSGASFATAPVRVSTGTDYT